jgi:5-formyltetrahydrofolate cyclo-ligase
MLDPGHIRKTIKQQRQSLSSYQKKTASQQILQQVLHLPFFHTSRKIALYWAVKGELDPIFIEEWSWEHRKNCFLPRLDLLHEKQLEFVSYKKNSILIPNQFNIPEPRARQKKIYPWQLDLIFVPLVAFDEEKNRLGMGAGFYDRSLAFTKKAAHPKPWLVGLAYDWQKVKKLNPQTWDIPLDVVVTDKKIYW